MEAAIPPPLHGRGAILKTIQWGALYSAGYIVRVPAIVRVNRLAQLGPLYSAGAALFGALLYSAGLVPLQTLYSAGSDVTPL